MRKIFALMLCIIIVCAMPIMVFAEDEIDTPVDEETEITEDTTVEETPLEEEIEGVGEAVADVPEDAVEEDTKVDFEKTFTEKLEAWILKEKELLAALVTIVLTTFYQIIKHKSLNKSIATLNNNAVTAVKDSSAAMDGVSVIVTGYSAEISELLAQYKKTAEDNLRLEEALNNAQAYLKSAKAANIELSNEVAELLVLANIPPSVKESLYARHKAALKTIEPEETVSENAGVSEDDGKEA